MGSEPLWKDLTAWAVSACGLLLTWFLAWLGRVAWSKLDSKADRAELLELARRQELRDIETRESRRALYNELRETNKRVGELAVAVGRLEGPR